MVAPNRQGTIRNLKFASFLVQVLNLGQFPRVLIRWELEPTRQNLSPLKFKVYRGESPEKMEPISHDISHRDLYEFVDTTPALDTIGQDFLYKVVATEYLSDVAIKTFETDTKTWQIGEDLVATYIVEEHEFKYRYVGGEPVAIFKNKRQGEHCPECFDVVLKRVTKSSCQTCYGTGKLGGFFNPIFIWMDMNPDPKITAITEFGEKTIGQRDGELTNYPLLQNRDIIFEVITGKIWRVESVQPALKRNTVIRQLVRLSEVNHSDIEYKLTIDEQLARQLVNDFEELRKEREF